MKFIPTEPKDNKRCGKKVHLICGAIAETGGALKRKGDSWVAEKKGAAFSRQVAAKPGTVLHFICAVHPDMQVEITVN